jgi:hypothetical protein
LFWPYYQGCQENGISYPFSGNDNKAGWKWFHNFMRRHSQLNLRKRQPTSASRAKVFTPESVTFFPIYEPLLEEIHFSSRGLYNSDETGLSVVERKLCSVVTLKDKQQIVVTVVTSMSAAGHFVPSFLVYARVHIKAELSDGAPPV